jgi:hypothetical protein
MCSVLDTDELPEIVRKEDAEGNITYVLPCGKTYDQRGTILKTKIEKSLVENSNNTNKSIKQQKETKNKLKETKKNLKTMTLNSDWAEGVYEYTTQLLDKLYEEGVITEGTSKDELMKKLFEGYEPGEKVPKMKTEKKKSSKPRKISGYQFFQKMEKDTYKEEFNSWKVTQEKPRYMTFMSEKWHELSEEEKAEWNQKAVVENEKTTVNEEEVDPEKEAE